MMLLSNSSMSSTVFTIKPDKVYIGAECERPNTIIYQEQESSGCHKDDFQRGIFKVNNKIYTPYQDTIKVNYFTN